MILKAKYFQLTDVSSSKNFYSRLEKLFWAYRTTICVEIADSSLQKRPNFLTSWCPEIHWKQKVPSLQCCFPPTMTKQIAAIPSSRHISLWNVQRRGGTFSKYFELLFFPTHIGGKGTFQEFFLKFLPFLHEYIAAYSTSATMNFLWSLMNILVCLFSFSVKKHHISRKSFLCKDVYRWHRRLMSKLGSWLGYDCLHLPLPQV